MKGKYFKRAVALITLGVLTLAMVWYSAQVLLIKRTDGITTMQGLYAQPEDSVDVLLIGSSHAGMNVDLSEMWNEYGISAYSPWGSVQPTWNTYYFLKEALAYQTPEVVVMEMYGSTVSGEYSDDARQVTNVLGMRGSLNKVEAIKTSSPPERWRNMFLLFPVIHGRYSSITRDDFMHFPWTDGLENEKGDSKRYGYGYPELKDASGVTDIMQLYPKTEEYIRKIIELLEERGIPLIMLTTPTFTSIEEQPYYNAVQVIADEYGVPFYNMNLMREKAGIDSSDFYSDAGYHLNTKGARKTALFLAEILKEKFELEDHRGDPKYESWEDHCKNQQKSYLRMITGVEDYFNELKRMDCAMFVIKNSSWEMSDNYRTLLDSFAQISSNSKEIEASGGGDWLLDGVNQGTLINYYFGDLYSEFDYDGHRFTADFKNGTGISVDGKMLVPLGEPGVICVVYDKESRTCIDAVQFLKDNNFQLERFSVQ